LQLQYGLDGDGKVTYDVLDKVSKTELIAWLRRNIFLPPISDEQFLQEVRLQRLMDENKRLLEDNKNLNKKLIEADNSGNHYEFMRLMVESTKLNDKIQANSERINKLIGLRKNN
jgi:hypothetical protein